jgi:tetratricopeptide (TPR) repeat protein
LMWHKRPDEAAIHYQNALDIQPEFAEAMSNLGYVEQAKGEFDRAAELYRSALAIKPGVGQTHYLLAGVLTSERKPAEAIAEYRTAVEINPDDPLALNDLSWVLATSSDAGLRNGAEAVTLAEHACAVVKYRNPQMIGTLAAAYAEAGRFDDAVKAAERARNAAAAAGWKALVKRNGELLALYRAGKPYHEEK